MADNSMDEGPESRHPFVLTFDGSSELRKNRPHPETKGATLLV